MSVFSELKYPVIIDGGLSNVLEAKGCDLNHSLWSAKLLDTDPGKLIDTHYEYIKAGAQIVATASYQATYQGYQEMGVGEVKAEELMLKSIALVHIAINKALVNGEITDNPLIAASIGPYGAYLADGSEYRGDYSISDNDLREFHDQRIHLFDNSTADLLAFETFPSYQEAKIIGDLTRNCQKKSWISFTCQDENHISDGTPIATCAELFKNHNSVEAIGVNCTAPKYISELIKAIKSVDTNLKIIVYPNSGEAYNASAKEWVGTSDPDLFLKMAKEWVALGADIIGGCCRIGPDHIQSLHKEILK